MKEGFCECGDTATVCEICVMTDCLEARMDEQASTIRELAEGAQDYIRTLEDKGSVASWLIIPLGTKPEPGAEDIEAALRGLLKGGEG